MILDSGLLFWPPCTCTVGISINRQYTCRPTVDMPDPSSFCHIDFTHVTASNTATSQIRSHLEYLIQTYNILLLILYSKLMKN